MKLILFTLLFIGVGSFSYGQDRKIDQLEILYSQSHFTKVIRKANKLLAIPDYDYSGMPVFYKSLATFNLIGQEDWFARNENALDEAIAYYDTFLMHDRSAIYIKSHYFEIADLKFYLVELRKTFKANHNDAQKIESFINTQLKGIHLYNVNLKPKKTDNTSPKKNKKEVSQKTPHKAQLSLRDKIVKFAKKYLGVKYKWAGTTPKGFDCSGYIGYVLKNYGFNLPRSAAAQKESSEKLKLNKAYKGDLIFFKSGTKVTHVGLVVSNLNESLTMIHASASKGIIITNIERSSYWKNKLSSAGRVIR